MEHRWGRRIRCSANVRIVTANGPSGPGRFRAVSSSGAFMETGLSIPNLSHIKIAIVRGESGKETELRAIVVRCESDGVALEWCETAEGSVCTDLGCETRCEASSTDPDQ